MEVLKKFLPLLLPLLMSGCIEDFNPEIDSKPRLCLNSLITAGEPIEVSVSRTWLYNDEDGAAHHEVNDATITVYANGVAVGPDYLPAEGDNIRIYVVSPTYGEAEAEVTVPMSVPAKMSEPIIEMTDKWSGEAQGDSRVGVQMNMRVAMTVNDPADVNNYYRLTYSDFAPEVSDEPSYIDAPVRFNYGNFVYQAEPIFSEHIGVVDVISGNDSEGFTFFTDRQFSGKSYTLNLSFNDMQYSLNLAEYSEEYLNCGLVFTLSSISESYYNWLCYRWNVDNGTLSDIADLGLGDPVWGYSNVSTGAGVVAACAKRSYTVSLKEFLKSIIR